MILADKIARLRFVEKLPRDAVVAEIGVQRGGFSTMVLTNAAPKEYHLIDCWEHQAGDKLGCMESQEQFDAMYDNVVDLFKDRDNVHIHRKYSSDAVTTFDDEYFDWVYIDADHTYEGISNDLKLWWPKVKTGGFLAGHDYYQMGQQVQVQRAVDEFIKENGLGFSFISPARRPDWAVQKKASRNDR